MAVSNSRRTRIPAQALQVCEHLGGTLVAQAGIFFDGLADDAIEFRRELGIKTGGEAGASCKMESKITAEVLPLKAIRPVAIS